MCPCASALILVRIFKLFFQTDYWKGSLSPGATSLSQLTVVLTSTKDLALKSNKNCSSSQLEFF